MPSDYNRLNYGKNMCNRACCYITCNCKSKLSPRWICKSPILHQPKHTPFPDWPWAYTHLHFAQVRTRRREYIREAKQDKATPSGLVAPMSQECTLCCLIKRFVGLSCNWAVTSLLFQILVMWDRTQKACLLGCNQPIVSNLC